MKPTIFLTVFLCMSHADFRLNIEENSDNNYKELVPYNVDSWIQHLQLQTCSLVSIGLKYFAIFIENISEYNGTSLESTKYFIGICHQSTLENWQFCAPELAKKRKYKCRFKLKPGVYHSRVHRRFCDIKIMVNNKDCSCETMSDRVDMIKVRGFPTCYVPPLPRTLCKYNVCGLSACNSVTENILHTVECDPNCTAGNPFCEGPLYRTSKPPEINSGWSKWSRVLEIGESPSNTMKTKAKKYRSIATCINKYTNKPDLDCLGPGTGCCPTNEENCSCNTFMENGILKLERLIYKKIIPHERKISPKIMLRFPFRRKKSLVKNYRFVRDVDDDDIEDDEPDDELAEDIELDEETEIFTEGTSPECEPCEKEEIATKMNEELREEHLKTETNNTIINLTKSRGIILSVSFLILLIILTLIGVNKILLAYTNVW